MSNDKANKEDRPIWLTSLADADRSATPPSTLEYRLQDAVRRRRRSILGKRIGSVALAAALATVLWLPSRTRSSLEMQPVDEAVTDAIAEAMSLTSDDEADFVPTLLASEQPLESVRVVRVSMPRGALASYGAASTDSSSTSDVTADLLVGQDGIARAIRVVK